MLTAPSYSGWLGTVAATATSAAGVAEPKPTLVDAARRLAAVAGTSTCHLAQSKEGILVPG
jgi:ribulose kinase